MFLVVTKEVAMLPYLPQLPADAHRRDLERAAKARRKRPAAADAADVVIRRATPADLRRLAALDDASVPVGPALVAEVGGAAAAAVPLAGGRPLADPFGRTGELVALLELRAAQVTGRAARPRFARWRSR
jgi:hypothetical protein